MPISGHIPTCILSNHSFVFCPSGFVGAPLLNMRYLAWKPNSQCGMGPFLWPNSFSSFLNVLNLAVKSSSRFSSSRKQSRLSSHCPRAPLFLAVVPTAAPSGRRRQLGHTPSQGALRLSRQCPGPQRVLGLGPLGVDTRMMGQGGKVNIKSMNVPSCTTELQ